MKYFGFIAFITIIIFGGCDGTVGTMEMKGKTLDENTKAAIPRRKIIIQALTKRDNNQTYEDVGQLISDSSGCFTYKLNKVKNAYLYNFYCVGDSTYASSTILLGLTELNKYGMFLSFSLCKLADLSITIYRKSQTPTCDTLYVSWESNGLEGKYLYPFKIENYGIKQDIELRWIGTKFKSVIKTKAFADKVTNIHYEIVRSRKRTEFTDTIICKRDVANYAYFKY
jgi:hypothetical protein